VPVVVNGSRVQNLARAPTDQALSSSAGQEMEQPRRSQIMKPTTPTRPRRSVKNVLRLIRQAGPETYAGLRACVLSRRLTATVSWRGLCRLSAAAKETGAERQRQAGWSPCDEVVRSVKQEPEASRSVCTDGENGRIPASDLILEADPAVEHERPPRCGVPCGREAFEHEVVELAAGDA